MKQTRRNNYRIVEKLPNKAMRVSEYAAQRPCSTGEIGVNTSYLYELVRKGKNTDFEIVVYKGVNFVIPLTNN